MERLKERITALINENNAEAESNTPDFILGQYLIACLEAFNAATKERDKWYGDEKIPGK